MEQKLAEGMAGAELAELAECGLVTYFKQPEAFARAVVEFAQSQGILQTTPILAS